jgi:SAM-dependent methyltransferase
MSERAGTAVLGTEALGLPSDYYERLFAVEQEHWWHRGMRAIAAALLGDRLTAPGVRLLDAGCGTGGFLHWALATGSLARATGVDISAEAVELAARRSPGADLHLAPLHELPFEDGSFDVAVASNVIQHIPEDRVLQSLTELRRVLSPSGALLVRTGGGLRGRRERDDWRLYDRAGLAAELEAGGFRCERVTYAALVPSLWGLVRGRRPRAPSREHHGIPRPAKRHPGDLGYRLLELEARFLGRSGRSLPYGHTLFALAVPGGGQDFERPGR